MSYRLITDATADLAPEMLEGLPEISVLPMEILLDGRPYAYGPGGNIGAEEFYQQLEAGSFASTSQINPTQYEEFFLPILEKPGRICCISALPPAFSVCTSRPWAACSGCAAGTRSGRSCA